MEMERPAGKTTIAPDVLVTLTRLTTLGVEGVARLASSPGSVNRIFRRDQDEGVTINVENNIIFIDIYVVIKSDCNVREVSHTIQSQVIRAITDTVGMQVERVNIHVEDIEYL
jgi:uncharacterized alkaline shock family protein YloU